MEVPGFLKHVLLWVLYIDSIHDLKKRIIEKAIEYVKDRTEEF
jgi:hypothetical protein